VTCRSKLRRRSGAVAPSIASRTGAWSFRAASLKAARSCFSGKGASVPAAHTSAAVSWSPGRWAPAPRHGWHLHMYLTPAHMLVPDPAPVPAPVPVPTGAPAPAARSKGVVSDTTGMSRPPPAAGSAKGKVLSSWSIHAASANAWVPVRVSSSAVPAEHSAPETVFRMFFFLRHASRFF
jgi:hypothetical protein